MTDIVIDNSGVMQIVDGDWQIGETDGQHMAVILGSQSGEWGEYPTMGVGIGDVILDNNFLYWEHRISQQFSADGIDVRKIKLSENKLELDAQY